MTKEELTTFEFLKDYKKIRDTCQFSEEIKNKGTWCIKYDVKCSYQTCEDLKKTHPLISCGTKKEKLGYHKNLVNDLRGLSKNELKILKFRSQNPPLSYGAISKRLNLSKSYVYKLFTKVKGYLNETGVNDKPIGCTNDKGKVNDSKFKFRLHNDDIAFEIFPVEFLFEKTVKLKYCEYLNKNTSTHHIRIFTNGKLLVRFKEDLGGKSAIEVKGKADQRIKDFLKNFKMRGVKFKYNDGRYIQTQREYAIIGIDFAKKLIREKKKFFVFDKVDGLCRAEVDFSKDRPEFENVHPKKGYSDVITSSEFFSDFLDNVCDLPSVTKQKTDVLMYAVEKFAKNSIDYAENIKLHLEVMQEMKETLKEIKNKLK